MIKMRPNGLGNSSQRPNQTIETQTEQLNKVGPPKSMAKLSVLIVSSLVVIIFGFTYLATLRSWPLEQVPSVYSDRNQTTRKPPLAQSDSQWTRIHFSRPAKSFNEPTNIEFGSQDFQLEPADDKSAQRRSKRWTQEAADSRDELKYRMRKRRVRRRNERMKFVILCQVLTGESPIQIRWFKDNKPICQFGSQLHLDGSQCNGDMADSPEQLGIELNQNEELGASLYFRFVQAKHAGNYTCIASNQFGSASYSSQMSVKDNPNSSLMGSAVASGTSIRVDSQPQFKLINSNHHVQTLENGSLAIRQATKDNEGVYLCEADNGVEPNLIKSLRLLVHLQAQFLDDLQLLDAGSGSGSASSSGPASSAGSSSLSLAHNLVNAGLMVPASSLTSQQTAPVKLGRVVQNSNVTRLLCQPFGDLPITLDWFKDGQLIYSHTWTHQMAPGGQHQLDLSPRLSIETRERRNLAAGPNAMAPNQQQQMSNKQVVASHTSAAFLETQLTISSVRRSDAGVYLCLARNAFGQSDRKLRLLVQEPPEAPEVVDVAHISSRSISLRWLAPHDGNSPIIKYTIEYRKQPDHSYSNIDTKQQASANSNDNFNQYSSYLDKLMPLKGAASDQDSPIVAQSQQTHQTAQQQQQQQQVQHTIHDLEPMTRYSMRIVAVNAIGRSKPSVSLSLRTEEEVPSTVPSSIEHRVVSSKSVRLRWTIAYSPEHELIDGFFVGYRSFEPAASSSAAMGSRQSPSAGADSMELLKQKPGAAEALAGQGSTQSTYTYKTIRLANQGFDTAIGNEHSQQQHQQQMHHHHHQQQQQQQQPDPATVFLEPVSSVTKSVAVTSPFSHLASSNQPATISSQPSQLLLVQTFEFVIGSLERDAEYTVLLQCFNKKGAGPASDPVVFRTFANDPPDKLLLIADEITESSIKLSWRTLATNPFGPTNPIQVAKQQQQQQQTELTDGFVLEFGRLMSAQQQQQKPIVGLAKPFDTEPIGAGQPAKQYRISSNSSLGVANGARLLSAHGQASGEPNKLPVDQWQAIQLPPQQRNHQLKNLECGTSYAIKVWAFNKIGKGEPSDLLTVSTRGKAPIAADRRSFLSANVSQVKVQLSAWYDGGCEIDKFTLQYRILGQSDWILVSNNIPREQSSLLIQDLQPATRYELLVSAQNHVGNTETSYRFATLDSSGQPIAATQLDQFDAASMSEYEAGSGRDYADDSLSRPLARLARQLLNSPLSFVLSSCLLVGLLLGLLLYRSQRLASLQSSAASSSSSTDSSNGSGFSKSPQLASGLRQSSALAACAHDQHQSVSLGPPTCSLFDSSDGAATQASGSGSVRGSGTQLLSNSAESPRLQLAAGAGVSAPSPYALQPNQECALYKSAFWAAPAPAPDQAPAECANYMPITYGCRPSAYHSTGVYASVQPKEPTGQLDDQCLVQMLMLGAHGQPVSEARYAAGNASSLHASLARPKQLAQAAVHKALGPQLGAQLTTSASSYNHTLGDRFGSAG